jgi:YhcH/YjgK/YiaL family protein
MALFGTLDILKEQADHQKFSIAFDYLAKVLQKDSKENKRLLDLPLNAFKKVRLDSDNFALEQVYTSKERAFCFFESHKQYIDVQLIVEGEEFIEVATSSSLHIVVPYDEKIDLIKYDSSSNTSIIQLQQGDIAIFYPEDAHMPCIKTGKPTKVVKTVVKVSI